MHAPIGVFHRRIVVVPEAGPEGGIVRAGLEDDVHHMELTLFHDGARITDLQTRTHRVPWNICPGAGEKLKELIGVPLQRMNTSTGRDAKEHCTHLFDLARLAAARAYLKSPVQYDGSVPDRIDNRTSAELLRDGKRVLDWDLTEFMVTTPGPFEGHETMGPPLWPAGIDDDTIEAALVLRRTIFVARSRDFEAARMVTGAMSDDDVRNEIKARGSLGHCFTYRLPHFDQAQRPDSRRNFSGRREDLLVNFPGTRTVAELAKA
jgi:hypothetical protein